MTSKRRKTNCMRKALAVLLAAALLLAGGVAPGLIASAAPVSADGLPAYKSIAYVTVPASENWSWVSADGQLRWEEDGNTLAEEYLPSGINAEKVTHINFAFGMIQAYQFDPEKPGRPLQVSGSDGIASPEAYKDPADGQYHYKVTLQGWIEEMNSLVDGRPYLHALVDLKKKNPHLKVLLSVGGWDSDGFCYMARTQESRAEFAQSCVDIIREYGLDGIDIDWEYPTNGGWGAIASCENDVGDARQLMKDLRAAFDAAFPEEHKLLSVASGCSQPWVDGPTFDVMDYMNVMCYDYSPGSGQSQAALDAAVGYMNSHAAMVGDTKENRAKINLGVPFYNEGGPYLVPYRKPWNGFVDASPEITEQKMTWVKENDYGGGFYWAYSMDSAGGDLRDAMFNTLNGADYQWPDTEPVPENDVITASSSSPVVFDVLANDYIPANRPVASPAAVAKLENEQDLAANDFSTAAQGENGILSLNEDGTVTYTPTRFMEQVDSFVYRIDSVADGVPVSKYAKVEVLPAQSVYYEDNFNAVSVSPDEVDQALDGGNSIAYTGKWSEVNGESSFSGGVYHQAGAAEIDISFAEYQASFGADKTYLEYLRYITSQMNDAYDVTIDENGNRVVAAPATFTFRFKGTGFELLSYCDDKTGVFTCQVTGISTAYSKSFTVSGLYDKAGEALYQVPVVSLEGLAYGEYEVKFTSNGTRVYPAKGNIVVIDGIRIFDPLGDPGGVDQYDEIEKYAVEYNLREMILRDPAQAKILNSIYSETNAASGSLGYGMDGPKNEVYLRSLNQGVAFAFDPSGVTAPESAVTLQLACANASGQGALTITCKAADGYQKSKTVTVEEGALQYYELTDLLPSKTAAATFTIVKTGDSGSGTNIISLRKIKSTAGAAFTSDISAFEPETAGLGISPALLQAKPGETISGRAFVRRADGSKVSPNIAGITALEAAVSDGGIAVLESFDPETGVFTLKGVRLGETALHVSGAGFQAVQTVHVVEEYAPSELSELLLGGNTADLKEKTTVEIPVLGVAYNTGEEYTLEADGGTLSLSVTDASVASAVFRDGVIAITGLAPGAANVTAIYQPADGKAIENTIAVTVRELELVSLSLTPEKLDLYTNRQGTVKVQGIYEDKSTKPGEGYTAVSSNPSVAAVEIAGDTITVLGTAPGDATITVAKGGIEAQLAVTVTDLLATGVSISPAASNAVTGGTLIQLTGTVLPAEASNPELTWTSDKPAVAQVDQNGLVTIGETSAPNTKETVTITATTSNDVSGTATIVVYDVSNATVYENKDYPNGYHIVIYDNSYWWAQWYVNTGDTPGSSANSAWLKVGDVVNEVRKVTITTQDLEVSAGGTL